MSLIDTINKIQMNGKTDTEVIPRLTAAPLQPTAPFLGDHALDPLEEKVMDALDPIGVRPKHFKAIMALIRHSKEQDDRLLTDVDAVLNSLRK